MNIFLTPIKGCKIMAGYNHHNLNHGYYIGIIHLIKNNIITFKNRQGEHEDIIWRFKEGINTAIIFGA